MPPIVPAISAASAPSDGVAAGAVAEIDSLVAAKLAAVAVAVGVIAALIAVAIVVSSAVVVGRLLHVQFGAVAQIYSRVRKAKKERCKQRPHDECLLEITAVS